MSKVKAFSGSINGCAVRFDRDAVWLSPPPFQSARKVAISEDEYQELSDAWPYDLGVPLRMLRNDREPEVDRWYHDELEDA